MKSKKIFILLAALGLSLAACNPATPSSSGSGSTSPSGSTPSEQSGSGSSDSGQQTIAVTGLALNKTELSLEAGKDETLTVTVTPDNASNTKVTWASSDATVAEVSARGKVTAKKVGKATITVTSESNPQVKATCEVTVTEEGGKYGSLSKPKTVAQVLAIAAEECKADGDKTSDVVYVKGIVWKAPTNKDTFSQNIYLKDALTDEKDLWVYSANHDALKVPYLHDELVLHGYLMNYGGKIEISNVTIGTDKIYPEIDTVTRGTSSITYNIENGSVSADAPTSGKNNSEFSFKVTPNQGYKVDRVAINGDAVEADANGLYKGIVKGDTTVNIDISAEGVVVNTVEMAYPANDNDSTNMVAGNNAATVGLDATIFEVTSTNTTGIYAGLNKSGEIRLYDNRKATDPTQIANGTTLTVSSRKVTITKIVIELTSASVGDMEVKAGDQVVTGNEGTYQINNGQFSIQNVSRIEGGAEAAGKQVIIKKVTISYTENADVAATAIAVSPKELTLKPEETGVLTAALTPSNATSTVVWESSDPTKATVDQSGKVTAVAQGTATITAKVSDTIKDTATVTVEAAEVINYGTAAAPLTVTEAKAVLDKTGSNMSKQPLFVKGIVSTNGTPNNYGQQEVWLQSDDGTVAKDFESWSTVLDSSITGDFSAKDSMKGYEVIITGYGKFYSPTYELTNTTIDGVRINPTIISMTREEVAATAIALDHNTAEVEVGKSIDLTATLTPDNATSAVSWKSSDESKATVTKGKVSGVAEGSATITAFIDADGNGEIGAEELKAECVVTVITPLVLDVKWTTAEFFGYDGSADIGYGTVTEKTLNGITLGFTDMAAYKNQGGDIQFKKTSGYLTFKSATEKRIAKLVLELSGTKNFTCSVYAASDVAGLETAQKATGVNQIYTFDETANVHALKIGGGTGASYLKSIGIVYAD